MSKVQNSPIEAGGIIYNVTVKVEHAIAKAWLNWLLSDYAPQIIATNCFTYYRVVKLLDVDESDGPTYAIQYYAKDKSAYEKFVAEFAVQFYHQSLDKWGQQYVDFATIMEVIY